MYNLPLSNDPLRSLFALEDLLPFVNGSSTPSIQEFENQFKDLDDGITIAMFGFCCIYGVYPAEDKLVLVRVSNEPTEILWYFN